MAILESLNLIGGFINIVTYGAVVYSTFYLKSEERRQRYVSLAVCMLSLLPPVIIISYDQLSWWEKLSNILCICAYATCLMREIWDQKLLVFVMVLIGASIVVKPNITFNLRVEGITDADYCAFLACCTASAPAIGWCLLKRWRFSYMDTYITFLGAIATLLSLSSDSSSTTVIFTCLSSAFGLHYSLYAFYVKCTTIAPISMDLHFESDGSSTEAEFGSPTYRSYLDLFDRMQSKRKDQFRGPDRLKMV